MRSGSRRSGAISLQQQAELLRARSNVARPDVLSGLFGSQLGLASDGRRFKVARCSRRAGKTTACPRMLAKAALEKPGSVALYITKTRLRAKQLMWSALTAMNRELKLNAHVSEAELSMRLGNGSTIRLGGANTKDEIYKLLGDPLSLVILDEAQSLPAYMSQLVDEVLAPSLIDFSGSLVLIGTPPPVPAGYFHEASESPNWAHHQWTVWDNPFIESKAGKTVRQLLDEELARRGVTEDEPSIQRDWFGRVCVDFESLVFKYSAATNHYDELPMRELPWQSVLVADIGWIDADAVGALRWTEDKKELYLTHESVLPKQTITQLGDRLKKLYTELNPMAVVVDFGGLGEKIAEELRSRWGLPVEAAEKSRKAENIELLNDAMRTGRFFASRQSRFAQDCALVEWDRDKSTPDRMVISDRYHSDACDMVLYGFRKALHWLSEDKPKEPAYGSREWALGRAAAQEREHYERLVRINQTRQREREEAMSGR